MLNCAAIAAFLPWLPVRYHTTRPNPLVLEKGLLMAEVPAGKLKILHLAKILWEQTDDEHGLTGPQLIEKLGELGVKVERKTLYADLEALRQFGLDVRKYPHRQPVEYALATRDFQEQELLLLADAVQSSRFLTEEKSDQLVGSIAHLGSRRTADNLRRRLHVEGRIKSQEDSVFGNVDVIQQAIDARRKVSFRYFKYDESKRRVEKHGGATYLETPVHLMYVDGEYYMVAWNDGSMPWNDGTAGFRHYRVDRMQAICVSDEPAASNEQVSAFDVADYQHGLFGMYHGELVQATLLVRGSAMDVIVDRFGRDVPSQPAGEGLCRVSVAVSPTPTFYGWLAILGQDARIEAPDALRKHYAGYLRDILSQYGE